MAFTLYRKYRPKKLSELVGQPVVQSTISSEIKTGAVAHAYLFVGPRGVGKTTTARILAKTVNCEAQKNGEPDDRCASCVAQNEGRSLDLIEIDAASHTQVDHVRDHILPASRTAPSIGKFKVFIIDEVHMLSLSAFNALLNVLEEPPPHAMFILATTEVHRVPATIISRCQRFDFRRIPMKDIAERLVMIAEREKITVDKTVADRIAKLADGSLRDAESLLGQLIGIGEKHVTDETADHILPRSNREIVLRMLQSTMNGDSAGALQSIDDAMKDGVHIGNYFHESIEILRNLLLIKLGVRMSEQIVPEMKAHALAESLRSISGHDLGMMLGIFLRHEQEQRFASIPQLPIELAVIECALMIGTDARRKFGTTGTRNTLDSDQGTSMSGGDGNQDAKIGDQWNGIVRRVRSSHPSLAALLNTAQPRDIVNGTLTLIFPYALHRERIMEDQTRRIIEQALAEAMGRTITISAVVDRTSVTAKSDATKNGNMDDVLEKAFRAFEGNTNTGRQHATP